jgi:hypothetical protein
VRRIFLHWTAGDYRSVFPAYHFCVALDEDGLPIVCETADLRANARALSAADEGYAAHVAGRNSFACGLAVAGMAGAAPHDFGAFPLREDMLDALCTVAAAICARYRIPIRAEFVGTHAEAAVEDGYFGSGDEQRWDIARLAADARPLVPEDAKRVGDALRARISRMAEAFVEGSAARRTEAPGTPFPEVHPMAEHTHAHAHEDGTAHAHEHEHHDHEHDHEHAEHAHAHSHDEHGEHEHAHAHEAGHEHDHEHHHDHDHDHDHAH